MRCNICDSAIAEIQYNTDLGQFEPCETCLHIALEAAGSFQDKPYAEDEEGAFFEPSAYDLLAGWSQGQLSEAG